MSDGADLLSPRAGTCSPLRLRVSWTPPVGDYKVGGYVEPLGPPPNLSTPRVNGVVLCRDSSYAYLGFEAVSTAGAEARNPAKDMPIGIIGALLICTALYIATSAVLVGIVPYAQLDTPAPIALAVNRMGMPWFAFLVKIGAIAGLSSVMLVLLYGQTRIFYTMSRGITRGHSKRGR